MRKTPASARLRCTRPLWSARCALAPVLALLLGLGGLLSAATPAQNLPNLTYATVDGTPLRLDLYRPPNPTAPTPVVLWVHGGGWCAGARSPLAGYAAALVQAGITVAAVQYRLTSTTPDCTNANGATWTAQIHDLGKTPICATPLVTGSFAPLSHWERGRG